MRVFDKTGTVFIDETPEGEGGRPEIDRTALRDLLIADLALALVEHGDDIETALTQYEAAMFPRAAAAAEASARGLDMCFAADARRASSVSSASWECRPRHS